MSEFTPAGRGAKMSKSQVKKYVKDLEEKRRKAQEKLDEAKKSSEWKKEEKEVKRLEELMEDL